MQLISVLLILIFSVSTAESTEADYVLPVYDRQPAKRLIATAEQRGGYRYGPPRLGNTSFFPTGPLGDAMVLKNLIAFGEDNAAISEAATQDAGAVLKAIDEVWPTDDAHCSADVLTDRRHQELG
jgi:hypothetical protein